MFLNGFYALYKATEAIYRRLLSLRGKNGVIVRNRGQCKIFCSQSRLFLVLALMLFQEQSKNSRQRSRETLKQCQVYQIPIHGASRNDDEDNVDTSLYFF